MDYISQWEKDLEGVMDFALKSSLEVLILNLRVALSGSRVTADVIKRSQYWSRAGPRSDRTSARHRKTVADSETGAIRLQSPGVPGAARWWERQEGSCPQKLLRACCPANTLLSGFGLQS